MSRPARVMTIAVVILVINYLGLFWQTSAVVFTLGMFTVMGVAILWIIRLVRRD